jgi:hypothetical protein
VLYDAFLDSLDSLLSLLSSLKISWGKPRTQDQLQERRYLVHIRFLQLLQSPKMNSSA